jgi:hypothetical protein
MTYLLDVAPLIALLYLSMSTSLVSQPGKRAWNWLSVPSANLGFFGSLLNRPLVCQWLMLTKRLRHGESNESRSLFHAIWKVSI